MVEPADLPVSDVSEITDQLFIASRLHARHVEHVRDLGIDLILSTIWLAPTRAFRRTPFRSMWLPMIDFPLTPLPLFILRRGAAAAVLVMATGGKVLIYCRAGRHRSVAMASCILIARGMTADEAMEVITAHRPVADPHAPHIERRIRAFEKDWLSRQRPATT
ncbi:MAG: hypothetical protein CVT67_02090 [Actinobacteria bacterium HGW-Actinobacteria-7]|jgi:hypothetical protein|nr:MAG: hypothetical protein CVT67_02090 [Actinobacteria bacterium HGW-Actinobacteria-7]